MAGFTPRRALRVLAFLAVIASAGGVAAGQPAPAAGSGADGRETGWLSLAGSGLVWLPDTSTLPRGRSNVALGLDNRDRDPLKMDVLDLDAAWVVGVAPRLETYGHAAIARAVTVSPRDVLFPSPIDLILPEGRPVPQRPYYPVYSPFPYVSRRGHGSQLRQFNPGEAVFGIKRTFLTPLGPRPAVALNGEIKLPLTRGLPDLQSGSGTGGIDERVRATAEWGGRRSSLLASLAYTHRGSGAWGDRLIVYRPGGEVSVTDQTLLLPGSLEFGAGFRQFVTSSAALVIEATKSMDVGGRTRAFRVPGPVDVTAGAQLRRGRLRATLCLRYHANSVKHRTYQWPLAGFADLVDVADEDRAAYLESLGAASVLPHLRRRGQTAFALPAGAPPLPPGGRIIPPGFTMGPHGEVAYVVFFTWALGPKP